MLSVTAREAADTIFKVFSMTQLRIKLSLPASQANALTTRPRSWQTTYYDSQLSVETNAAFTQAGWEALLISHN